MPVRGPYFIMKGNFAPAGRVSVPVGFAAAADRAAVPRTPPAAPGVSSFHSKGVSMRRIAAGPAPLLALSLALALLVSALSAVFAPPARAEEVKNWKELTLLYLSDIKGEIEPCG